MSARSNGYFCEQFLLARPLAEAGVSVVTLRAGDTPEKHFRKLRAQLPHRNQGLHTLVADLCERGIDEEIADVAWGACGRGPRIRRGDGRDRWPEAGAALINGGGFQTRQVIGETDAHGGRGVSRPLTPGNVPATMYRRPGIDPATAIADPSQRPNPLLDDVRGIEELG